MSSRVYFFLAIALVTGFCVGWLVRGPGQAGDVGSSVDSSDRSSPRSGGVDRTRMSGLKNTTHQDGEDLADDDEADDSLQVDSEALIALMGAKVPRLEERGQLIQPDGELERLIGLTEEEARSMNELWGRTKPELDSLRTANVKHQRLEDGGVWLGVEPFAEGEELRQDFLLTTHRVLGESRGRVFLDAVGAHGAFGRWGKTVGSGFTVHMFAQEDESLLYEIVEQAAADGSRNRKWNTSTIPAHLAEMASAVGISLSP
jgi:hypothetical protein